MAWYDKLLFWRTKTVELDYEVEGCFTLPGAELGEPENGGQGLGVDDAEVLDGPGHRDEEVS